MSTPPTVNVAFKVIVTAEAAPGEIVTVAVTNPDGSAGPTVTGLTVDDGLGTPKSITATTGVATINAGPGYKATPSIQSDATYAADVGGVFPFDALKSRLVTIDSTSVT